MVIEQDQLIYSVNRDVGRRVLRSDATQLVCFRCRGAMSVYWLAYVRRPNQEHADGTVVVCEDCHWTAGG